MTDKATLSVAEISAFVVGLSFALGGGVLFGKLTALGDAATEFITVADLATSAARYAPVAILCAAALAVAQIVLPPFPAKEGPSSFPRWAYKALNLSVLIAVISFWTLTPSPRLAAIILLSALAGGWAFMKIANYQATIGSIPNWVPALALLVVLIIVGFLQSYTNTIENVSRSGDRAPPSSHIICIEGQCRAGLLIARFSEVTVIRWPRAVGLDYIANSKIDRLKVANPILQKPIFDVWGWIAAGWTQLFGQRGPLPAPVP